MPIKVEIRVCVPLEGSDQQEVRGRWACSVVEERSNTLKKTKYLITMLAIGLLAGTFLSGTAHAAGITVNTTDDELNVDGDCSLREAIESANTDAAADACFPGSGPDVIAVPAGTYTLSIAGANEDANATGDLDILTT